MLTLRCIQHKGRIFHENRAKEENDYGGDLETITKEE
jgi:hypothetical protein